MNYYQRHIGDYIRDTSHLTLLQHGIYNRLLDVYYLNETGIAVDKAARLIGAKTTAEKRVLQEVLDEFFKVHGAVYTHARCDSEILKYRTKSKKNSDSSNKRWNPQNEDADAMPTDSERIANASETHTERNASQEPLPTNQEPLTMMGECADAPPARQVNTATAARRRTSPGSRASNSRTVFQVPSLVDVADEFAIKFSNAFPVRDRTAMRKIAESWAEDFMMHYGKVGWRVGRNPMKDWRLAVAQWFKRNVEDNKHLTYGRQTDGRPQTARSATPIAVRRPTEQDALDIVSAADRWDANRLDANRRDPDRSA